MTEIYRWTGALPEAFVGLITYHCSLPGRYARLRFTLAIDEDQAAPFAPRVEEAFAATLAAFKGSAPAEAEIARARGAIKTEIQLLARLNGAFLANVHAPGNVKSVSVGRDEASPGGEPRGAALEGLLDLTVEVFHTARADVRYTLTVEGEAETKGGA